MLPAARSRELRNQSLDMISIVAPDGRRKSTEAGNARVRLSTSALVKYLSGRDATTIHSV